ncbi:hypothetical protein CR513_30062, partial [Mucuna pruriens]
MGLCNKLDEDEKVDDIILGATNETLYKYLSKLMHSKFEMNMMRELIWKDQKPMSTQMHLVDFFIYLIVSRPDIMFSKSQDFRFVGYYDAYYVGDRTQRKNRSGGCHFIGSCLISCANKKQNLPYQLLKDYFIDTDNQGADIFTKCIT